MNYAKEPRRSANHIKICPGTCAVAFLSEKTVNALQTLIERQTLLLIPTPNIFDSTRFVLSDLHNHLWPTAGAFAPNLLQRSQPLRRGTSPQTCCIPERRYWQQNCETSPGQPDNMAHESPMEGQLMKASSCCTEAKGE